MGVGRKSIYDTKIRSRFTDIERWIKGGANEAQVAKALGVSYSVFNKYKREKKELRDFISGIDRTEIILDLRSALLKKAMGFNFEEKKQYIKKDEDGNTNTYTEITTRYSAPDTAAINLALKNYDTSNWANDPAQLELKRQELELKKKSLEKDEW